ncbi:hypothetical protein HAHE_10550 [Haloferula helveola]|uniref:Uncharacterized protein n=1 Tax=Haloferula helveola TaxID=490095 RepID=A0ABN6H2E6_9BACT|nr:hypothetical protein HAHE_10550 [Haloferula helveola]
MKPITSYALICAVSTIAAQAAVTDPVGYMTVPIPGTGGGSPSKLQIGNQGLLPNGPALVDDGTGVTFGSDGGGDFLEDSDGAWTAGDYVNGAVFSHVLEITSGAAHVGVLSWITSTTDTPAKIYTADDLSGAGAGAGYRVWETYTMASLFGNPPAATTLGSGATAASADTVQIYDPTTNTYTTFYYRVPTKGTPGWASDDGTILDPASYAIHPNDGLVLQRKQVGDGELVIEGSLKTGPGNILVQGDLGADTLNILATQHPVEQLTPANSGLYTGDAATGLLGAATASASDNILVFDAATNSYTTFYYRVPTKGTPGWVSDDAGILDPANYEFPSTGALLLIRRGGNDSFEWSVPEVTVAP